MEFDDEIELTVEGGQVNAGTGYTATVTGMTELGDLADGTYYIRYKEDSNHLASADTPIVLNKGRKLHVTVPEVQTGYTVTVDKTELCWKDDVELTFTLKEGYSKLENFAVKITVNGNTMTLDDQVETFGENGKFTVSDVQSDVSIAVEGVADVTAPDAEITLGTNKWNEFFSNIIFGLFFKETQNVTITAEDQGSRVEQIFYHLSAKALTVEEVIALADSDWTEYTEEFSLDPQDEYIIYAKVTDQVNNTKYISSDKGIVIDSIAPVITGIAGGETYYGDTTFGVTEKHEDVVKVDDKSVTLTDGNYTITADGKEHTVVVTDKSGNSSAEIKITVITIDSLDDTMDGITTDNVKSSDKEAIEEVKVLVEELIIVTGKEFADGLSASATDRPILLVQAGSDLQEEQRAIVEQFKTGKICILGGKAAVSEELEGKFKAIAETEEHVIRISGKDRYETSVKVAETFYESPRAVVVAYGKNFPDGLCGGPLAAALNIPLLLARACYTADAAAYISAQNITSGYVLGGISVLSEETVQTVFALGEKTE